MNQVIYTQDLEPITVLDVPMHMLDHIEASGWGRATVKPKHPDDKPEYLLLQQRVLMAGGQEYKFLYTTQEVLALGLAPQQLPGQKQLYQYMYGVLEQQREIINKQHKTIERLRGKSADGSGTF